MQKIFAVIWPLISIPCLAGEAKLGSYVMARGVIEVCETWTDRILDIVEIESAENLTIMDLPDIEVLGRTEVEITNSILNVIERESGTRPQSLSIELIDSESEYESLLDVRL